MAFHDPLAQVRDAARRYRGELDLAFYLLELIKDIARDGLNSDSNDEEREALAEIGSLLGLESEWDDERDMEVYQ